MRLFIAEKPSVAKAIAAELGVTGKGDGYIACGNDRITWCFGHMLEQEEPDFYTEDTIPCHEKTGKKLWRAEDLPIIPETWALKPKEDAKKQLNIIGELLKEANTVVHAGDSDREGQLLVDEVLQWFDNRKKVLRFWVAAHDSISLQRGLATLKDNVSFEGFSNAALARARADWLIGMNLSRAFTLKASRGGSYALLTVGRVQTPTLAMVVARDKEIESFQAIPYYLIKAVMQHEKGSFIALWQPKETQAHLDSERRLLDAGNAQEIAAKISDKEGLVTEYRVDKKTRYHPKVYSLSEITLVASNRFGYSAEVTLNTCQSLYENHKLTTYPRTDCGYLPESQHQDAPGILEALFAVNPALQDLIVKTDTGIKSRTWDDSKVTAHFGIIPTMHKGNLAALSETERNIYDLIVKSYIAQFYPVHEYSSTVVRMVIADECFETTGTTVINEGWCQVFNEESDNKASQKLPFMQADEKITCMKAEVENSKTRPPARFTEGTLQKAMENIHLYMTDEAHKKILRDGDGIGTSATRASIISELKRRGYLEVNGKQILSTLSGRSILNALPEAVKSPILTAVFERMLKSMEKSPELLDVFVTRQAELVSEEVRKANQGSIRIAGLQKKKSTIHAGKKSKKQV